MDNQNGETIFVTGKGMKMPAVLIAGFVLIGISTALSVAFSSEFFTIIFGVAIIYGIGCIIMYFKYQHMTISVSNLRIMGSEVYHSYVDISLSRVNGVQLNGNGFFTVTYINDSGKQKKAVFPKMENSEQICNAIYSLISAPPSPQ
ncbi:MAG: hypothetical protein K2N56_12495 [Oscillospiraceae bacterium]|nr:hypothetical protein [Oscillospiraceae bacterium]